MENELILSLNKNRMFDKKQVILVDGVEKLENIIISKIVIDGEIDYVPKIDDFFDEKNYNPIKITHYRYMYKGKRTDLDTLIFNIFINLIKGIIYISLNNFSNFKGKISNIDVFLKYSTKLKL